MSFPARASEIERKFAADVRPVLGVRAQLTQVFVNLITNACHAMEPQGGTLSVETSLNMQRRTISVTITDTGTGIGATDLRHIFEPFFTTKTEGRGTGLGLSIVRNIVLLHGGVNRGRQHPQCGNGVRARAPHRALKSRTARQSAASMARVQSIRTGKHALARLVGTDGRSAVAGEGLHHSAGAAFRRSGTGTGTFIGTRDPRPIATNAGGS